MHARGGGGLSSATAASCGWRPPQGLAGLVACGLLLAAEGMRNAKRLQVVVTLRSGHRDGGLLPWHLQCMRAGLICGSFGRQAQDCRAPCHSGPGRLRHACAGLLLLLLRVWQQLQAVGNMYWGVAYGRVRCPCGREWEKRASGQPGAAARCCWHDLPRHVFQRRPRKGRAEQQEEPPAHAPLLSEWTALHPPPPVAESTVHVGFTTQRPPPLRPVLMKHPATHLPHLPRTCRACLPGWLPCCSLRPWSRTMPR